MQEQNIDKDILIYADELEQSGRYSVEKQCYQHGKTTVYEHSVNVAEMSCHLANKFHLHVDRHSLIRGALLHDYFLYDWHDRVRCPRLHGFCHPRIAFHNANEDFHLNKIESNIIKRHMFPLTLIPPITTEGWLVCISDKICAIKETFYKANK